MTITEKAHPFAKIVFSAFIVNFLLLFSSYAQDRQGVYKTLNSIKITGLERTKPYVIQRELGFKKGDSISQKDIQLAITHIRNTQLFSAVDFKIKEHSYSWELIIHVQERWTTIPILKINAGGGVSQTTTGIYDPNVLGHYIELGGQIEAIENVSSGVFWFKNPRLFDQKLGIDLQLWDTNRLRTKYDQTTDDLSVINGFLLSNQKFHLGFTHEFQSDLNGSIFWEFDKNSFSDRFVTKEVKAILNTKGLPPATEFHILGFELLKGRIDYKGFLIDGMEWGGQIKLAQSQDDNTSDFWQTDLTFRYYKSLLTSATFAQRILAGFTTTDAIQYWYYLGGLDRIRGYTDNRFAGKMYWLSNTEFRYPVAQSKNYIIQATSFVDIISAGEKTSDLSTIKGASLGLGLRIILPKFYRMTLRLDWATRLLKEDEQTFSFGVQHFF